MVLLLIVPLLRKLAMMRVMVISVLGPDAVDDLLLDGNLNVDGVALFLVLLVAHLLWHFVALGNCVMRTMFLRYIVAFRNGDIVALFLRHLFGNINIFARLVRDFLTILFIVVSGFAFFGVCGVAFLFLFVSGFVNSFAFLLLLISTFFLVRSFAVFFLLVFAVLLVDGVALGDFDLLADFVVFGFVFSFVRLDLLLAFPVFCLAGNVEFNVVALLFGDLMALFFRNIVALGYGDVVTFFFGHLRVHRNINVFTLLVRHLFGNINVFARFMRDFRTFLFIVVGGFAFFGVCSVAFLFLFVSGFVDSFTFLFLVISGYGFVDGVTFLFLFVVAMLLVDCVALGLIVVFTFLFLFGFTGLGVVVTAVASLEQVQ